MNGNVALKKEVLPAHGWQSLSGKPRMRVVSAKPERRADMGSLPILEREKWSRQIIESVVEPLKKNPVKPLSRAEIDAWTSRLLDENRGKDNHSC